MNLTQFIEDAIQYISEAVTRIFAPSDDEYPVIGIQPFDGEIVSKHHKVTYW